MVPPLHVLSHSRDISCVAGWRFDPDQATRLRQSGHFASHHHTAAAVAAVIAVDINSDNAISLTHSQFDTLAHSPSSPVELLRAMPAALLLSEGTRLAAHSPLVRRARMAPHWPPD